MIEVTPESFIESLEHSDLLSELGLKPSGHADTYVEPGGRRLYVRDDVGVLRIEVRRISTYGQGKA